MAFTKQRKGFIAVDVNTDQINLRYLGPCSQYRPTRIIHKADGSIKDGPSFCIVMEHPIKNAVAGQISIEMLNEALGEIGYKIVKISTDEGD